MNFVKTWKEVVRFLWDWSWLWLQRTLKSRWVRPENATITHYRSICGTLRKRHRTRITACHEEDNLCKAIRSLSLTLSPSLSLSLSLSLLQADGKTRKTQMLLLIYCFMYLPLFLGVLCWSLFWYALLYVLSSFAIILTRNRELVALLNCLLYVLLL